MLLWNLELWDFFSGESRYINRFYWNFHSLFKMIRGSLSILMIFIVEFSRVMGLLIWIHYFPCRVITWIMFKQFFLKCLHIVENERRILVNFIVVHCTSGVMRLVFLNPPFPCCAIEFCSMNCAETFIHCWEFLRDSLFQIWQILLQDFKNYTIWFSDISFLYCSF